jgi:hypothetical protein
MKYGFFYDSYDHAYYYWESVVLVEKLLMVMAITLLQRRNATVQVLVALIVVSLATVVQITFRPAGCNMLHTLTRASLYVLQCTLFLLMVRAPGGGGGVGCCMGGGGGSRCPSGSGALERALTLLDRRLLLLPLLLALLPPPTPPKLIPKSFPLPTPPPNPTRRCPTSRRSRRRPSSPRHS